MYSVKKVKNFMGREGHGFNADLYRDNKKVATVIDDASGGQITIRWTDIEADKVPLENGWKATPEEKMFYDHLKSQPKVPAFGVELDCTADIFITELVSKSEIAKKCKNNTCFTLKNQDNGAYYTIKEKYSEGIKQYLQNEYGDNLKEIYNETL